MTAQAPFPLTLALAQSRLPKKSWAIIGQIRTLSIKWLNSKIGRIHPEEMALILEGLNEIIGD